MRNKKKYKAKKKCLYINLLQSLFLYKKEKLKKDSMAGHKETAAENKPVEEIIEGQVNPLITAER